MDIEKNKNSYVVQANRLIEARYSLTVLEQRLVLAMISMISHNDEDFKEYRLNLNDLVAILNVDKRNIYANLEKTLNKLMSRVLHIPKSEGGYIKSHWVALADYFEETGEVALSFHPKIRPYLINLKKEFTRYRLSVVIQFQSTYTIRIYSLLKQYQRIGNRKIALEELKYILGLENEYSVYRDFKKRVLMQAKKELDAIEPETGAAKSDITFELEEIREKRKVKILNFKIIEQKYFQDDLFDRKLSRYSLVSTMRTIGMLDDEIDNYFSILSLEAIDQVLKIYQQKISPQEDSKEYLIQLLEESLKPLEKSNNLFLGVIQENSLNWHAIYQYLEEHQLVDKIINKARKNKDIVTVKAYEKEGINSPTLLVPIREFLLEHNVLNKFSSI